MISVAVGVVWEGTAPSHQFCNCRRPLISFAGAGGSPSSMGSGRSARYFPRGSNNQNRFVWIANINEIDGHSSPPNSRLYWSPPVRQVTSAEPAFSQSVHPGMVTNPSSSSQTTGSGPGIAGWRRKSRHREISLLKVGSNGDREVPLGNKIGVNRSFQLNPGYPAKLNPGCPMAMRYPSSST